MSATPAVGLVAASAAPPDVAVVTGTAGGIGAATAAAFADAGFTVIGIDRLDLATARARGLLPAGADATLTPERYRHVVADILDPADPAALAAAAGPVRHVAAVAGGALPGEVAEPDPVALDLGAFTASVTVNLTAQFAVAQAALTQLRTTGGDRTLTFTSSINALAGIGLLGYSAAKAGLLALTRDLAVTEGPAGIRVNAVVPGTVPTLRTLALHQHPEHVQAMAASTALARTATCEEIAAAFLVLATTLTAVTGQSLVVDAGQTARWR